MKFVTLAALLLSSVVYGAPQAQAPSSSVTMNTPTNLVPCQPVMLSWSGGTAPYFLSIQDGNNFNGPALQRFDQQTGTSFSWTVNVPAGSSLAFLLRDSSGQTSLTAPVTVQPGGQDTCVTNSVSLAPSSAGSPPPATSGGATPPPKTPAVGPVATSRPASSSTPSKSAAVPSSSSNAAPKLTVSGFVVPAVAALFGYVIMA